MVATGIETVGLITYFATDTILVKCTLGHSWKYINHWIHSVFLIGFHVANYIQTKCHEFAIKKSIHEKHLPCDKRKKIQFIQNVLIDWRTLRRRSSRSDSVRFGFETGFFFFSLLLLECIIAIQIGIKHK